MKCCLNQCCSSNWLRGPRDFPANSLCDCWLSPPLPTSAPPLPPPCPAPPCPALSAARTDACSFFFSRQPSASVFKTRTVETQRVCLGNTSALTLVKNSNGPSQEKILIWPTSVFWDPQKSRKFVTVEQQPTHPSTHPPSALPSSAGNNLTPGLCWKLLTPPKAVGVKTADVSLGSVHVRLSVRQ